MNSLPTIPLFSPGRLVAMPGALALLEQINKSLWNSCRDIFAATGAISARKTRRKTN